MPVPESDYLGSDSTAVLKPKARIEIVEVVESDFRQHKVEIGNEYGLVVTRRVDVDIEKPYK